MRDQIRIPLRRPVLMGAIAVLISAYVAAAQTIHCDILRVSDNSYAGRCSRDATTVSMLIVSPPKGSTARRWRGTALARIFGEKGDTTKDKVDWNTFQPAFVDVGTADPIFSLCWCKITNATIDTEGLHFDADPAKRSSATTKDLEVLKRTRAYFKSAASWDRYDKRERAISYCPSRPTTRTLFCALYDASVAVRGEFYAQAPPNAALFEAMRAASPREYRHPLTDFNNDKLIDFVTMTRMLDDAVSRIKDLLAKQRAPHAGLSP